MLCMQDTNCVTLNNLASVENKDMSCYEAKVEESEKPAVTMSWATGLSRQCFTTEQLQSVNHQPSQ